MALYILNIRDNEDNYLYETLVFESVKELEQARQVILDFDYEFYERENCDDLDYIQELLDTLKQHDLLKNKATTIATVFIR